MEAKYIALILIFSLVAPAGNLMAKERRGATLVLEKTDGQRIRGELIAVKQSSLLLLDSESGVDVSVNIDEIKVLTIVKKSEFLKRAGVNILIFGGIGAFFGYLAGEKPGWWSRGEVARAGAVSGACIALFSVVLTSEKTEDEIIQIEGKSNWKIAVILQELRSKARIPDYK